MKEITSYWKALETYGILNPDGAVRFHSRFEKDLARLYRKKVSEIAIKISKNERYKENDAINELFGQRQQPTAARFGNTPVGWSQELPELEPKTSFAPSPEEMEALRKEAIPEEPQMELMKSDPRFYFNDDEIGTPDVIPMKSQINTTTPGNVMLPTTGVKRTINPDGTRVGA